MKENEADFTKTGLKKAGRAIAPVYLWNYLCFPTERGLLGSTASRLQYPPPSGHEETKCTPGMVRGIFLCMRAVWFLCHHEIPHDNPALDIDHPSNEFHLLFVKQPALCATSYDKIEQVYSDSKIIRWTFRLKDTVSPDEAIVLGVPRNRPGNEGTGRIYP